MNFYIGKQISTFERSIECSWKILIKSFCSAKTNLILVLDILWLGLYQHKMFQKILQKVSNPYLKTSTLGILMQM